MNKQIKVKANAKGKRKKKITLLESLGPSVDEDEVRSLHPAAPCQRAETPRVIYEI